MTNSIPAAEGTECYLSRHKRGVSQCPAVPHSQRRVSKVSCLRHSIHRPLLEVCRVTCLFLARWWCPNDRKKLSVFPVVCFCFSEIRSPALIRPIGCELLQLMSLQLVQGGCVSTGTQYCGQSVSDEKEENKEAERRFTFLLFLFKEFAVVLERSRGEKKCPTLKS